MRCTKCGNEIADNAKFCGRCGNKIVEETQGIIPQPSVINNNQNSGQPGMNYTEVNNAQPNMNYNAVNNAQPNINYHQPNNGQTNTNYNVSSQAGYSGHIGKKSGSGFVKIIVLAVLVVACYMGYKEVEKRFLLPIGSWKSADTPIEMNFLEDGELQMGAYGTFAGNMKWKKTSGDNYFISGEVPELLGFSLGEVGCEAHFDWKNKKLTVNFGFGEVTFDKEE